VVFFSRINHPEYPGQRRNRRTKEKEKKPKKNRHKSRDT
jgi:hypothetical protein